MRISNKKQRQVGIALTYVQMFVSMLITVFITPIALQKLGQNEYGLYNLAMSIISCLNLLNLGFGASYIRFYTHYKTNEDEEGIQKLNGLYMVVFSIMGLVVLILGLLLSFNCGLLFNETYTTRDLKIAKKLMLLLTFNCAISFPMSVYTSIITSQERFIFQKLLNIFNTAFSQVIGVVVVLFGYGSVGMVISSITITLTVNIINIFYCHKKLNTKFKFGNIDVLLLKEIAVFSIFIAINHVIDMINSQADKIILGKMMTPTAVAIYAIASTIQVIYANFSTAVSSVFTPKIHSIVISKKKDSDNQLTDLFIKVGRIQYFILMLILTGFIFFGKYFINIWAGVEYEYAYYLVLVLIIPITVPLIQNIGIEVQRAKNKHQFRSILYFVMAIINVIVSIILCKFYGLIGVVIGTGVSYVVCNGIIMNIYYHKKLGLNTVKFWKSISRCSLGLILPALFGVVLTKKIPFTNFKIFILSIIIYSVIYVISVYLLGFNREERKFVNKLFGKFRKKREVIQGVNGMKKVAILTLPGRFNYGNRFQNYSLQNFLENNFNVDVKTMKWPLIVSNKEWKNKRIYRISHFFHIYNSRLKAKRYFKIKRFDKAVKFDEKIYTINSMNELNKQYDYFVVGSDQVWNTRNETRSFLIPGIDKKKKISYAASVAKNNLGLEKYFYGIYLDTFKGISVREKGSIDALKSLTQKEVKCHIDPVFLTAADEWRKLEKEPRFVGKKPYLLECCLSGLNKEYEEKIQLIAKKFNLKRINIFNKALSPNEFLYLINNAKIIFTDSFHAIVFSIILKKPVIHLKRLIEDDMTLRMDNLEELFNFKFADIGSISENITEEIFEFKMKDSEEIIKSEKERTIEYFNNMFTDEPQKNSLDDKDFFCSGCGLCKNICPVGAIEYITDDEGFIQKKIDGKKCIHCGLCVKNCPAITEFNKLEKNNLYILKRNTELKDNSSTTGFFSKLAEKILEEKGCVFGACYDVKSNKFYKVETLKDLDKIKGSKYYQFNYTEIYSEIEKELKNGRKVLVCGTPCQVAGISQKFKINENLYLIQLICHGVPSKKLYDECCIETFGEIPKEVNFKYHYPTWDNYSVKYTLKDGEKIIAQKDDLFMKSFLSDIALNNCCYSCHFVGKEIGSDIIIGDCWDVKSINKKMYDKNGVSIVKINTEKGKILFDSCSGDFDVKVIPKNKIQKCNYNLFDEFKREDLFYNKAKFIELYRTKEIESLTDYFNKPHQTPKQSKLKSFIKKIAKKVLGIK